jgi:hypothetical protein
MSVDPSVIHHSLSIPQSWGGLLCIDIDAGNSNGPEHLFLASDHEALSSLDRQYMPNGMALEADCSFLDIVNAASLAKAPPTTSQLSQIPLVPSLAVLWEGGQPAPSPGSVNAPDDRLQKTSDDLSRAKTMTAFFNALDETGGGGSSAHGECHELQDGLLPASTATPPSDVAGSTSRRSAVMVLPQIDEGSELFSQPERSQSDIDAEALVMMAEQEEEDADDELRQALAKEEEEEEEKDMDDILQSQREPAAAPEGPPSTTEGPGLQGDPELPLEDDAFEDPSLLLRSQSAPSPLPRLLSPAPSMIGSQRRESFPSPAPLLRVARVASTPSSAGDDVLVYSSQGRLRTLAPRVRPPAAASLVNVRGLYAPRASWAYFSKPEDLVRMSCPAAGSGVFSCLVVVAAVCFPASGHGDGREMVCVLSWCWWCRFSCRNQCSAGSVAHLLGKVRCQGSRDGSEIKAAWG